MSIELLVKSSLTHTLWISENLLSFQPQPLRRMRCKSSPKETGSLSGSCQDRASVRSIVMNSNANSEYPSTK
jgi:hypothetical protein